MRKSLRYGSAVGLYVLLAFLTLYFCQNFLHVPDTAAQMMLVAVLGVGCVCLVSLSLRYRLPAMLVWAGLMLLMIWGSWVISEKTVRSPYIGNVSTAVMLKNCSTFFLMLFAGYAIGRRMFMTTERNLAICLTVLAVAIIHYILCIRLAYDARIDIRLTSNNGAYCFVSVLPFMVPLFRTRRIWFTCIFFICLIFIVLSAKRGAMVCLIVAIIYFYHHYLRRDRENRWKSLIALLSVMVCVCAIFVNEYLSNEYFRYRIQTTLGGYASGRDTIYATIIESICGESDIFTLFFGNGMLHSVRVCGNYAHCDWLELMTDFGIAGTVLYAGFFISFLRFAAKVRRRVPDNVVFTMRMIMLLLFTSSIFSMGFIAIFNSFDMLLLGILMGNCRLYRRIGAPSTLS